MRLIITVGASASMVIPAAQSLGMSEDASERPSLLTVSRAVSAAGLKPGEDIVAIDETRRTAICTLQDRPEPDLQGRTPLQDMLSGRSQEPYFCGLEEIGHTDIYDRGANWQLARSGTCAYVSSLSTLFAATNTPAVTGLEGVAVIDVRDPRNPKPIELLRDEASLEAAETLAAMDAGGRHVLVAGDYSNGQPGDGNTLALYDTTNCRNPALTASLELPWGVHDIAVTSDARRVYGSVEAESGVGVIDISSLTAPEILGVFPLNLPDGQVASCHTPTISADGKYLYCPSRTMSGGSRPDENNKSLWPNSGPTVWRVSESALATGRNPFVFESESPIAGQGWHHIALARIHGKDYVVAASELAFGDTGVECDATAFPRIWHLDDSKRLEVVGQFRLEVQDHCSESTIEAENLLGNYASHYNTVAPYKDVALGLFSYLGAGMRVVDLSDPANPREIAYYKPGADPQTALQPAGVHAARLYYDPNLTEACGSRNEFFPERGEIWFVCQSTGFHVVKLHDATLRSVGSQASG